MVACPLRALGVMYQFMALFTQYEMISVWDNMSTIIRLPRLFLSTEYLFEQRIGQVTMNSFISDLNTKLG